MSGEILAHFPRAAALLADAERGGYAPLLLTWLVESRAAAVAWRQARGLVCLTPGCDRPALWMSRSAVAVPGRCRACLEAEDGP